MSDKRKIIVHYHLFKNAGSSVDQLLKHNFPDGWIGFDGDGAGNIITASDLENQINSSVDKVAFSSHQIVPPLPRVDATVYPIVFLRDPIDRIKSAYLFEWKKQLGLEQPKGTFVEFVQEKFKWNRRSSVEEFQTIRLSNTEVDTFHTEKISDDEMLGRACDFISSLNFVGIVDQFVKSNELLGAYLGEAFSDFAVKEVKANVLQDITMAQATKRLKIREELGDELFEMIVERNVLDEALYQHGCKCLNELYVARFESDKSLAV